MYRKGGELIKRIILSLIIIVFCSCLFLDKVHAQKIYFENENKVILSECEYNFISNLFWDGFQKIMSLEDYKKIFFDGLNCTKSIEHEQQLYSINKSTHTTKNKSLNIAKSCADDTCFIVVTLSWLNAPIVRNYDVVGAYLDSTYLIRTDVTTYVNNTLFSETQYQDNGFGTSVKLPSSENDIKIVQYYTVKKSGIVYASYQHAIANLSYADSKKYDISRKGYGGVILFNNSVKPYYDGMGGVSIVL